MMKVLLVSMNLIFVSRIPCLDHVSKKDFVNLLQPLWVCKGILSYLFDLSEVSIMFCVFILVYPILCTYPRMSNLHERLEPWIYPWPETLAWETMSLWFILAVWGISLRGDLLGISRNCIFYGLMLSLTFPSWGGVRTWSQVECSSVY